MTVRCHIWYFNVKFYETQAFSRSEYLKEKATNKLGQKYTVYPISLPSIPFRGPLYFHRSLKCGTMSQFYCKLDCLCNALRQLLQCRLYVVRQYLIYKWLNQCGLISLSFQTNTYSYSLFESMPRSKSDIFTYEGSHSANIPHTGGRININSPFLEVLMTAHTYVNTPLPPTYGMRFVRPMSHY